MTEFTKTTKPLGIKNYGHIPHLPGSRMGPGDHKCSEGQARIATEKVRDKHDRIFVQEKLDGSNVGVALLNGTILPLGRAGYPAISSPHVMHRHFANWVYENEERFRAVLREGERVVGEWLMQAHGTRYELKHEPFVAIDLMVGTTRTPWLETDARLTPGQFVTPATVWSVSPITIERVMEILNNGGYHGALDPVEGAVWRVERHIQVSHGSVERKWVVDFLVKYVRPDKEDGFYLPKEVDGKTVGEPVWNWHPKEVENS